MFLLCYFLALILIGISAESKDKKTKHCRKDEALGNVDCLFGEIQGILKREKLRIRKEKEAFDSVAKKLKNVHFCSAVKLNVGGQIFTTSLETLKKDAGSMLHAMFSGRFDTKPAEDGSYFIDRDGTCFRYILNYLRTGKLSLPDDKPIRKDVLEEARFYEIQGIIDKLCPKPYSESVILSANQAKWLADVHGNTRLFNGFSLIYRATRDGWRSSNFHSKCDSFNGPTMVVIKSTGGYIFGGYTEQSWSQSVQYNSHNSYKSDPSAFLFSLVNPGGSTQVKMKLRYRDEQNSIYCNNEYGPTFGGISEDRHNPHKRAKIEGEYSSFTRHDLFISDSPHSSQCSVNIGQAYELPEGQSTSFLTGSQYFNVAEMEVYGLGQNRDLDYCD